MSEGFHRRFGALLSSARAAADPMPARPDLSVFIAPPTLEIANQARRQLPVESFLVVVTPAREGVEEDSLNRSLPDDERTLFVTLDQDERYLEKIKLVHSELKSKSVNVYCVDPLREPLAESIRRIQQTINDVASSLKQQKRFRLIYLRDSIRNLPFILGKIPLSLANVSAATPAVVCAAGPSLRTQIDFLRDHQANIIVIAVGRVAPLLINSGVTPDFVVDVDPDTFFDWREDLTRDYNGIVVSVASAAPRITAPFYNIVFGWGGAPTFNQWLGNQSVHLQNLRVSRSVTVTALDVAVSLGCGNVALIGSDLCYSLTGESHADAHRASIDDQAIQRRVPGNDGGEALSDTSFMGIRDALDAHARSVHDSTSNVTIHNCTAGGVLIPHLKRTSLDAFVKSFAIRPKPNKLTVERQDPPLRETIQRVQRSAERLGRRHATLANLADEQRNLIQLLAQDGDHDQIAAAQSRARQLQDALDGDAPDEFERLALAAADEHLDDVMSEMNHELSDGLNLNPLRRLEVHHWRQTFALDVIGEIRSDLTAAVQASMSKTAFANYAERITTPAFDSFRRQAIDFVRRSNPDYAEFLAARSFSEAEGFILCGYGQFAPAITIITDKGEEVPLDQAASLEVKARRSVSEFLERSQFDEKRDAVVFAVPGNWSHVVEFAKRVPRAAMMVVDPWPKVTSAVIDLFPFSHILPSSTVVVCADERFPNWRRLHNDVHRKWKSENRNVHWYFQPEIANVPGMKDFIENLKKMS